MYMYETHLHTSPVSRCARASVRENMEFYKFLGYDGIFITNHFLDGNINIDDDVAYREKIEFYFSDYEVAKSLENEIGIKVFCGVEMSYRGTDFLVYGLDKEWYLAHPEIMDMKKTDELAFLMDNGALVIQAHPYREADYIDYIRLLPRSVQGVEVVNATMSDETNDMAKRYADQYGLLKFAGSDNHSAGNRTRLAGVCSETPIGDVNEFITMFKSGEMSIFEMRYKEESNIWQRQF